MKPWEIAALEQTVADQDAELARLRPIAAAAHTFCSAWDGRKPLDVMVAVTTALLAIHRNQTPQQPSPEVSS